jgi:hypothetical protein
VTVTPIAKPGKRPRKTKYKSRERAFGYMTWVRSQPCVLWSMRGSIAVAAGVTATPCGGPTEADHAGDRGIGRKSKDGETIPICKQHHFQRTNVSGYFAGFTPHEMWAWRHDAIALTQARARREGVAIPDV